MARRSPSILTPLTLIEEGRRLDLKGDWTEAQDIFRRAADLADARGEGATRAEALRRLGHIRAKRSEWIEALQHYEESLAVCLREGDPLGAAAALSSMGTVHFERGEWDQGKGRYAEALRRARRARDARLVAQIQNNLGALHNVLGEWAEAIACYKRSVPLLRRLRNSRGLAETYNNLGLTYKDRGEWTDAARYLDRSLSLSRRIGDVRLHSTASLNRAQVALEMADLVQAREACDEAFEILSRLSDRLGTAEALRLYGTIFRRMHKWTLAERHLNEAIRLTREYDNPLGLAEVHRELGLLYQDQKRSRRALEALGQSFRVFRELKARKYLEDVDRHIFDLEDIYFRIAQSMGAAVESKDTYTFGHSQRVANYALELAQGISLSPEEKKGILVAAFLHDLGKVRLKKKILCKPGKLTPEEYEEIRKHPLWGVEKLRSIEFPWEVKPFILHHQERWDGSGYPEGLTAEAIPLGARIITIADYFDALVTDRPYRPALPLQTALGIMERESGKTFDPLLVPIFIGLAREKARRLGEAGAFRYEAFFQLWSSQAALRGFESPASAPGEAAVASADQPAVASARALRAAS